MLKYYLKNDDRRVFEISKDAYIKRVYTENGIIFECDNGKSILTTSSKEEVREWFETLTIVTNQ